MIRHLFIVRPFGVQQGVDFEAVEGALIRPAIAGIKDLQGGTTQAIFEQGNIREDMFRELVTADLVIADVSIHNANVFYELGVRHGLRPSVTFLLRAKLDKFPFDLQTDRYLEYDHEHLDNAETIARLTEALEATLNAGRVDSPVYEVLPSLRSPDPASLRVVPRDFREEVERAREANQRGDLRLLAEEARSFPWASEALRTVGRAQIDLTAFAGARDTFEWLRDIRPDDVETNSRLATIYQRLAKEAAPTQPGLARDYSARSDQAIQHVIDSLVPGSWDRAEAYALKARNLKARWHDACARVDSSNVRAAALRGPELKSACDTYQEGFAYDLNHFYSGVNALALLRVRIELAEALPEVWLELFEQEDDARRELDDLRATFQQLAATVRMSVDASERNLKQQKDPDEDRRMWTLISSADLTLLTSSKPRLVAQRFREALADAPGFAISAVRDQLEMFRQLAVRPEFVAAALAAVDEKQETVELPASAPRLGRVLLFTGHMVDEPSRETPRFPGTESAEADARRMIREAIERERHLETGTMVGVGGGAAGGDIIFHEVCAELGIPTRLFLALPPNLFAVESVGHAGPRWIDRFYQLCGRVQPRVLSETKDLPSWVKRKPNYTIWQRNNLWMLFNALALHAERLTLLALWDKGKADGPGGTEDLVKQVTDRGYKVQRLEAERLKTFTS